MHKLQHFRLSGFFSFMVLVMSLLSPAALSAAELSVAEGAHKLVLQISDNDPQKMNTVLNVAANVSQLYSERGEEVDIKIVAFNQGLHMLRSDTSPVLKRITGFSKSMINVKFHACGNTKAAMEKKSGKDVPILEFAKVVPAGAVKIIELNEQGYTVIRP